MRVRSITSSSVFAKFSRMMIASTPASLSWCSSSRAVYSGFTLTTMQPARSTAAMATMYCGTLGIISAMRVPFTKPLDCSQAPKRRRHLVELAELDAMVHESSRIAARESTERLVEQVDQRCVFRRVDGGRHPRRVALQPGLCDGLQHGCSSQHGFGRWSRRAGAPATVIVLTACRRCVCPCRLRQPYAWPLRTAQSPARVRADRCRRETRVRHASP